MNIQQIYSAMLADGTIGDYRAYDHDSLSNHFDISPIEANILHYMIEAEFAECATIGGYFMARLGAELPDSEGDNPGAMELDSACGADCKLAIDACALMLAHSRAAYGDYQSADSHSKANAQQEIIAHCADIVLCYICG